MSKDNKKEEQNEINIDEAVVKLQKDIATSINKSSLPLSVINLIVKQIAIEVEQIGYTQNQQINAE